MALVKQFLKWIGVKERIHSADNIPPFFREDEIWWCHVGENVGVEMNGKGERFTRPVLILTKYDRYSFFGLPLTTKMKTGTWYANVVFKELSQTIILSQGRVYDYRRLKERIGELSEAHAKNVRTLYASLHGMKISKK